MPEPATVAIIGALGQLLKLPFVAVVKTLITLLNLIPMPVYEVFGVWGQGADNRPDSREVHILIKGKRRAHLGTCLIAWTRGAVIEAPLNVKGETCKGIYNEDFQDIVKKWVW